MSHKAKQEQHDMEDSPLQQVEARTAEPHDSQAAASSWEGAAAPVPPTIVISPEKKPSPNKLLRLKSSGALGQAISDLEGPPSDHESCTSRVKGPSHWIGKLSPAAAFDGRRLRNDIRYAENCCNQLKMTDAAEAGLFMCHVTSTGFLCCDHIWCARSVFTFSMFGLSLTQP